MGNILIWLILLVTIPRWAMTLQQVDTYQAFGVPITAVGEGIVLELGCWFIIQVYSDAKSEAHRYRAWLEAHIERMEEQGKHSRKPKEEPRLRGYKVLLVAFVLLLALTLLAQTPFIMAQFLPDETMADLLSRRLLWGYSIVLVIAPEVMTAAIALALHFHQVVDEIRYESGRAKEKSRRVAAQIERVSGQLWEWLRGRSAKTHELRSELEQVRTALHEKDGTIARQLADIVSLRARAEREEDMPAQFREASRDDWFGIYTGLNGNRTDLDARRVNELLVTYQFWPVPDSTARDWLRKAEAEAQQSAQPAPAPAPQQRAAVGEEER